MSNGAVGLARLTLARGLFSAGNAAIAVVWGYAVFVINNSAFLTGLLDTGYTLAFAAASSWLTIRHQLLAARTSIVVNGLISATVTAAVGLLTALNDYVWLLLLVVVIGVGTGVNYPAWFAQLRRGRDGNELHGQIGTYESFRVVAVLSGTAGGGLLAHVLGLKPTTLLIAVAFATGGLLALTFPRSDGLPAPDQPATLPKHPKRWWRSITESGCYSDCWPPCS